MHAPEAGLVTGILPAQIWVTKTWLLWTFPALHCTRSIIGAFRVLSSIKREKKNYKNSLKYRNLNSPGCRGAFAAVVADPHAANRHGVRLANVTLFNTAGSIVLANSGYGGSILKTAKSL